VSLATIIAVEVHVTREHLAAGRPGNCRLCALALAITDAIEDATGTRVYYDGADARADVTLSGGGILVLGLGPDVTAVMARYDAGKPVDPFSFVAEVTEALTEEGTR
jgi:hypothetical protein